MYSTTFGNPSPSPTPFFPQTQKAWRMLRLMLGNRTWVRGHAQDYILSYFSMLTTRRRDTHSLQISRITERALYYYNARPHPSEIAHADAELKRGIDEDWKASVQRYPEVLEYFYGLVRLDLPGDEEQGVRDPPLSALGGGMGGGRKVRVREPHEAGGKRRRREERPVAPMPPPGRVPSRGGGGGFAPPMGYGYVPSGY